MPATSTQPRPLSAGIQSVLVIAALGLFAGIAAADDGAALYTKKCAGCHQAGGVGKVGQFPPLNNLGIWLALPEGRQWIADSVVVGPYGDVDIGGKNYHGFMPSYAARMNDAEIVAVLRYIGETLNPPAPGYQPFTEAMVVTARALPDEEASIQSNRRKLPPR